MEPEPALEMLDLDWNYLMRRIEQHKVTPFVGAAASASPTGKSLPTGGELARVWAHEFGFPHKHIGREDAGLDLMEIAQFLSVRRGSKFPKQLIKEQFEGVPPPDRSAADETYGLLAELELPVYITTNYDDFLCQALEAANREPVREYCRWNPKIRREAQPSKLDDPSYEPTVDRPLVFHLHGILECPESIVITEDDYLGFIVALSWHRNQILPDIIQQAFTGTSLMFMGYGLHDWSFKVIFQALVIAMERSLRGRSVSVQLEEEDRNQRGYYAEYMCEKSIEVFWGKLNQFVVNIRSRLGATPERLPQP